MVNERFLTLDLYTQILTNGTLVEQVWIRLLKIFLIYIPKQTIQESLKSYKNNKTQVCIIN